jgi:hypothetical protein
MGPHHAPRNFNSPSHFTLIFLFVVLFRFFLLITHQGTDDQPQLVKIGLQLVEQGGSALPQCGWGVDMLMDAVTKDLGGSCACFLELCSGCSLCISFSQQALLLMVLNIYLLCIIGYIQK